MNTNKADVYTYVTARIIDRLEQGECPWINTRTKPLLLARSATTGKTYRGINAFLLSNSCYASAFWATYKTVESLKGHVKKGEHSSMCVFWKRYETKETSVNKRTGEEEHKMVPVLRFYGVFNLEQTEGVTDPLLDVANIPDPIAKADEVIANFANKPAVVFGSSGKACYNVALDKVILPQQSSFNSSAQFYRTYFHELVHSTGHASRLNRFSTESAEHDFDGERGLEELVAEMGAAMLLAECGIFEECAEKNASYCQHWINELKADSKLIVKAAGRAQKAVDLILGRTYDHEEHNGETEPTIATPTPATDESIKEAPAAPTPEPEPRTPTPAEPISEPLPEPTPEPQPISEPEPTEPEQPATGPLIPGDFVAYKGHDSILRSLDFVARTCTLEISTGDTARLEFKVVPMTRLGRPVDTLYAGQVLHRLVEYARPRLVGRAKFPRSVSSA
jgi:antirestriction protein ArdC